MIKIHKLASYTWVEVISPTKEELRQVTNDYQTPVKFQSYMMDRHEQPRATFDELSGFGALVVRAIADQSSERMLTMPIFLGFSNTLLVTVCHDEKQGKMLSDGAQVEYPSVVEHIISILFDTISPYFDQLDVISHKAEELEGMHQRSISNHSLDELAALKTSLVYLRSATAGNLVALQELQPTIKTNVTLSSSLMQQSMAAISDLLIEYKQCQTMFDVVGDVVSETESAFGNILNNKLNQTMQFLTIWSLVLAIPPIVSGFYGMNVKLPLASADQAWFYTVVLTLLMVVVMIWYIKRDGRFRK
ncbi:magnesium transporter CorA family protein [Lentilactobacillus parabuchneri]|uniref:magnesium transporter CorA family protein n=1 Tax=Lentilactobacillus parabuchneri TaxID=152331 RepID=UPI0022357595|nr:magnesium transporter CorA family protein [Lentilactobacillus parabuchneri]MCW4397620.1 magnesium transporter CorA family protein [Lentilactobacillus parabuchneri]